MSTIRDLSFRGRWTDAERTVKTTPLDPLDRVWVNGRPFVYSGKNNEVGGQQPFATWRVHFPGGVSATVASLRIAGHVVARPLADSTTL